MTTIDTSKDNDTKVASPDAIIENLGGCGRFQIRMSIVVHLIKTIICFSFMGMIIISAAPPWWCTDGATGNDVKTCTVHENNTAVQYCQSKSCVNGNNSKCQNFGFESSLNTIVNEFNLVCDRDYIPSIINSIQISGVLVGNIVAGQIADLFGRKPPFFTSIVILIGFNLFGFFSTSWQMFAIARFFTGVGGGFFLTTQYCLLSEFTLAKWRVWIVGFPSWPIQSCLFSLLAWLIHDWRYIQLMTALMGIPCFLAWCVIPESFRWYIAHDKPEKAEVIVRAVAKFNRRTEFDIDKMLRKPDTKEDKKYTFLDLFKSKEMVKVTFLLAANWVALGLVSYGIAFGIQSLSGNIYFNLFLFGLTEIPSKAIALWLQNRFGRRFTSILCFSTVAIGGSVVGIVQTSDVPNKDELTNAFALVSNMGIATAWGSVQTMTIEIYPTVIRNIGFGTLSVTGRIGAIVGPQLVYLNTYIPGLLYYACATISIICVVGILFLPETMDRNLKDRIKQEFDLENAVIHDIVKNNNEDKESPEINIKEPTRPKTKDSRKHLDVTDRKKTIPYSVSSKTETTHM
ncbi:organic cation/carnitine transporter 2-like [Ruditapes philippinarum]|uniref:organic cation/carnitine transporter 2-like n=1 Tax=Ruditapes philippinarum TaxID=129788 RepID=UPI00295B72E3|nr:organic cation/carnitine transporter 2-like [Ruditapes philippinarum]